ncbi:MAG: lysophospholipid acyltransferase family protein [Dehalococcoidia bacterium]
MLLYWSWRVAVFLRRLFPTELCYLVSSLAGEIIWRFFMPAEQKSATKRNLARVTGLAGARLESLGRKNYRSYARLWADFVRFPTLTPAQIRDKVVSDKWNYVEDILGRGKGLIFVTLHMGNWDMAGGGCARRGYPFHVIAERFENRWLDRLVVETRDALGVRVVFEDRPLEAFRVLRRNEVLALLIDIPTPDGVAVSFFGETAFLPAGPARLALRSGAGIINIGFYKRRGRGDTIYCHVAPPVYPIRSGDEEADVRALTQRMADNFEPMIRANPEQWYVFRDLWPGPEPRA